LLLHNKFISKGALSGLRDLVHQDVFSSPPFLNSVIDLCGIHEIRTGNVVKVRDVANLIAEYLGGSVVDTLKHNDLNPDIFPYSNKINFLTFSCYSFPYELYSTLDTFKESLSNYFDASHIGFN